MVEMALLDLPRRAEWEAWYAAHQHRLLSIPGFHASQRFETIHPAASPFVALHEVESADVFTSAPYRAQAGPGNTGEWQQKMNNWHRNLFDAAHTPDVGPDARLLVLEAGSPPLPSHVPVTWMQAVGLDRSVPRRGIAVTTPPIAAGLAGAPGVRVLNPLAPRLRRG
jgi:hypothetical protein